MDTTYVSGAANTKLPEDLYVGRGAGRSLLCVRIHKIHNGCGVVHTKPRRFSLNHICIFQHAQRVASAAVRSIRSAVICTQITEHEAWA